MANALAIDSKTSWGFAIGSFPFNKDWEEWLKRLSGDFKYLFPSFHLPTSNLRETPHQSIKKFLHNFRTDAGRKLSNLRRCMPRPSVPAQATGFVRGHAAAGLEQFIQAVLLWQVLQVPFSLGTIGSQGLKLCFLRGSSVTDFRRPCASCFNPFVLSNGPSMSKRWKGLTGSLSQRSKKSDPSYIICSWFTMRTIIPAT